MREVIALTCLVSESMLDKVYLFTFPLISHQTEPLETTNEYKDQVQHKFQPLSYGTEEMFPNIISGSLKCTFPTLRNVIWIFLIQSVRKRLDTPN